MKWVVLAVSLAACSGSTAPAVTVSVSGGDIAIEGDTPVRALRVHLAWDASLGVTSISAGKDATRMNIVRSDLPSDPSSSTSAQVLISDTRKIHLPTRGVVIHLETSGTGAVRITGADAVVDGPTNAQVVIK